MCKQIIFKIAVELPYLSQMNVTLQIWFCRDINVCNA